MEDIDVLDEFGNITGIVKSRKDVHQDGDWHRTVQVWIINSKGEILLQKRGPMKKHPNMWHISSSGHIVSKQDSLTTCIKEIKEELGLDIKKEDLKYQFTSTRITIFDKDYIEKEFHDVYLLRLDVKIEDIKLEESEISKVKFVSLNELKDMVKNNDANLRKPENINDVIKCMEKELDV